MRITSLVLSHDEVVHLKCSMLNKMPGLGFDKYANLKAGYAFMIGHAGKKLLFMGQEFAQLREWSEKRELDWFLLAEPEHQAIPELDERPAPFVQEEQSPLRSGQHLGGDSSGSTRTTGTGAFTASCATEKAARRICSLSSIFTPMARDDYRVGVPRRKQYKLIMNSDDLQYGGKGEVRPQGLQGCEVPSATEGPTHLPTSCLPTGVAIFEF